MKHIVKRVLLIAICIIVIAVVTVSIIKNIQKKSAAEYRETQYRETEQAIAELNEKSYFYGYQMLGDTPEDYIANYGGRFSETEEDYYGGNQYNGKWGIVNISLRSKNGHILGIYVGDNAQDAFAIIQAEGYVLEKEEDRCYKFVKNDITIGVTVSQEDVVEIIGVSVYDPSGQWMVF